MNTCIDVSDSILWLFSGIKRRWILMLVIVLCFFVISKNFLVVPSSWEVMGNNFTRCFIKNARKFSIETKKCKQKYLFGICVQRWWHGKLSSHSKRVNFYNDESIDGKECHAVNCSNILQNMLHIQDVVQLTVNRLIPKIRT